MTQESRTPEPPVLALDETEFLKTRKGEFHATLHFCDQDRIGCMLHNVEVKPLNDTRLVVDPSLVAKALSHLDGGLVVIEAEGPGRRAVLRSALPRPVGPTIQFFEIVIDPRDGLVLRRYIYDRTSGERTAVPFSMTRDTIDRLVSDLKKLL